MKESEMVIGCLLALIEANPDSHGYQLRHMLQKMGYNLDGAHLYRILRSMEREGLVSSYMAPSKNGPQRRNYTTTNAGKAKLIHFDNALDYDIVHINQVKNAVRVVILERQHFHQEGAYPARLPM